MKTKLFLVVSVLILAFSSCQKDLASDWEGTYNGTGNLFDRVVITKVDKKTIKLELQSGVLGSYVTFATVAKGNLTGATTLAVDENGGILGSSDQFHMTGAGSLSDNKLTLSGQAQNKNNSSDIRTYTFTGTK